MYLNSVIIQMLWCNLSCTIAPNGSPMLQHGGSLRFCSLRNRPPFFSVPSNLPHKAVKHSQQSNTCLFAFRPKMSRSESHSTASFPTAAPDGSVSCTIHQTGDGQQETCPRYELLPRSPLPVSLPCHHQCLRHMPGSL